MTRDKQRHDRHDPKPLSRDLLLALEAESGRSLEEAMRGLTAEYDELKREFNPLTSEF